MTAVHFELLLVLDEGILNCHKLVVFPELWSAGGRETFAIAQRSVIN